MAWTSPRTWVANEVVSAALMNTHVRDNLLQTAPAKASAAGQQVWSTAANAIAMVPAACYCTGDYTTTGSFATITGMSWAVGTTDIWCFTGLIYHAITGGGHALTQFSIPASATVYYHSMLSNETVDTFNNADTTWFPNSFTNNPATNDLSTAKNGMMPILGFVIMGGTGGTVALQAKLNGGTSDVIKKGSFLDLKRLA